MNHLFKLFLKPTPNLDPELESEWRQGPWSKKEEMEQKLCEYKISSQVSQLRFLLFGPIGAGKSTFINSVRTTIEGYNCAGALASSVSADGVGKHSYTLQLRSHKLRNGKDGSFLPFVMVDSMGVEPGESEGFLDDIVEILQGRIKEGYKFNPSAAMSKKDSHYNREPTLNDKIHCLVYVLPADKISLISDDVFRKMKTVQKKARDLEIPQVIIMTMVDEACRLVKNDLKKIYTSIRIKKKMEECSNRLGIPMNCIFPVKGYSEEIDNNREIDALILKALTNIVNFANDNVKDQREKEEEEKEE